MEERKVGSWIRRSEFSKEEEKFFDWIIILFLNYLPRSFSKGSWDIYYYNMLL